MSENRVNRIMNDPYGRVVVKEKDGFKAYIHEFPGCEAFGGTNIEALANLEEEARKWVIEALNEGKLIVGPLRPEQFKFLMERVLGV